MKPSASVNPVTFGCWHRDGEDSEAKVPHEIVPGVSAAFAAAAAIRRSLTDRDWASRHSFHRPSCRLAQPCGAAGTRSCNPRRLHARPRSHPARGRMAGRGAAAGTSLRSRLARRAAWPASASHHSCALDRAAPAAAPSLLIAGWTVREQVSESASRQVSGPAELAELA